MLYTKAQHTIFDMLTELGYDIHTVMLAEITPDYLYVTERVEGRPGETITRKLNLRIGEKW